MFHFIGKQFTKDAIPRNLAHETYENFSGRAKKTVLNCPLDIINRTIESIPKQVVQVIKMKRQRTNYFYSYIVEYTSH